MGNSEFQKMRTLYYKAMQTIKIQNTRIENLEQKYENVKQENKKLCTLVNKYNN